MPKKPVTKRERPHRFPLGSVALGGAVGVGAALLLAWLARRGNGGLQAPGTGRSGTSNVTAFVPRQPTAPQPPVNAPRQPRSVPPLWPDRLEVHFLFESSLSQQGEYSFARDAVVVSDGRTPPIRLRSVAAGQSVIPDLAAYIQANAGPNTRVLLDDTRTPSGERAWTDQGQASVQRQLVRLTGLPDSHFEWLALT